MAARLYFPRCFNLAAAAAFIGSFFLTRPVARADDSTLATVRAHTEAAAAALQRWYNPTNGLWDTTSWWNAANCVDAVEDLVVLQNGGPHRAVITHTFEANARGKFLNDYYDDEGWWALTWLRAFDLTGDARYLNAAKILFADMTGGWDAHCGGGIWWSKQRRYKNAIANELFLLVAIRLHQRSPGDAAYYDWALREWRWFKNSGLINAQNLVNDGLNDACANNGKHTWTYNQGVLVGGLTELYRVSGDTNYLATAVAIADATIRTLIDTNGILRDPCESVECRGGDIPQFKGIFMRYLALLHDVDGAPAQLDFLDRNARAIWDLDRDAANEFGLKWSGPFDEADAARQSSALAALAAVTPPVAPGLSNSIAHWTAAALDHETGRRDAFNAWRADPLRDRAAGYLVKAATATLPAGSYTAQFELKVDNFNRDREHVATLSVIDVKTDRLLASRELARNQFSNTLYAVFPLKFATKGNPCELRIHWPRRDHAAWLTARSLWIDR